MEGLGIDETENKGVKTAGDPRIKGADGKSEGFIISQIHSHGLGGHIAVADGDEGPADLGLEHLDGGDN